MAFATSGEEVTSKRSGGVLTPHSLALSSRLVLLGTRAINEWCRQLVARQERSPPVAQRPCRSSSTWESERSVVRCRASRLE
jgi:hypothetical protein